MENYRYSRYEYLFSRGTTIPGFAAVMSKDQEKKSQSSQRCCFPLRAQGTCVTLS